MLYYIANYYEDKFGENYMVGIIQLLTSLLVFLSLGLIVTVPAALAIPGQWETSKGNFYKSAVLWTGLVFLIGFSSTLTK
jgi:photosystem II core protein PsbZ